MIEWLRFIYDICTSGEVPANWREITIAANAATAAAYFWIPAVMAVVFARWREELPYRGLWIGFVIFITACGLSHVVHTLHAAVDQSSHTWSELVVMIGTAVVSLGTAAGFTYLLPTILRLTSPSAARRKLEAAVDRATADLQRALEHQRLLLLEVHHRVKNNLQVTASLVNLHMKNSPDSAGDLRALRDRISAMAAVHAQLQDVTATRLKARPFLEALAASMQGGKGSDSAAAIEVDGSDFEVQLDHAASFALIMQEVLSQALPLPGTGRGNKRLLVKLERSGTQRSLTVSGTGLADARQASPVGDRLIGALVVQLNGKAGWERDASGDLVFRMTFEDDGASSAEARIGKQLTGALAASA